MRIMVFDVPAESGGALSVLNDFYDECKNDTKNEYIFVVSKPKLQETNNVRVLRFPWIKKSWIHRIYFDYFVAPTLVIRYKADEIFSLQNVIIPQTKVFQTVYLHNSLPFAEYRFSFIENRLLWVYQNVISRIIYKSIVKADKVIVQSHWMKDKCINLLDVDGDKITVMPPNIEVVVKKKFISNKKSLSTFFYPASGVIFKNHKLIVNACSFLKREGFDDYKVIFTLEGNENGQIVELYKFVTDNNLPIEFIGALTREQVFEYYSKSVLLFPSYIESSPLPLTEAKMHNTPILTSDFSFSHEILDEYEKVDFFDSFNFKDLASKMLKFIDS